MKISDFTIRQLTSEDWEQYRDTRLEAVRNHPDAFGSSYEEEKDRSEDGWKERIENAYIYGAFYSEELAAIVGLFLHKNLKMRHSAGLHGVYTKGKFRGFKLCKTLTQKALEELPPVIEKVVAHVTSHNEAAQKTYTDLGFETYGLDKFALKYNDVYYDEILMVKFLR